MVGDPKEARSFFKGSIDELRVSNRKRNFSVPPMKKFKPDMHTMALWHFDESGRTLQDSADDNTLVLPEGASLPIRRLSVDPSGKLATEWGAMKGG